MKIEEQWLDIELVTVEFLGFNDVRYTRMLIVPIGYSKQEIETLLLNEFPPVKEYLSITFFEEGFYYNGKCFASATQLDLFNEFIS